MRKITDGEFSKILKEHKNWISTNEEEGKRADLSGANLSFANLSRIYLRNANLSDAYLNYADLIGADLSDANLSGANLNYAKLSSANLSGANLIQVKNLSINKHSKVKTLYKAKLDPELMKQVEDKYPHLLEEPNV